MENLMITEVIILTGQAPSNQFFSRYAGPHRLATELRKNNISTKVINGLGYFSVDDLINMCDKFIGTETLVLGISTTFFVEYAMRHALFPSKLYAGDSFKLIIDKVIKHYKNIYPNLKIVVGGPTARLNVIDTSVVDLFIEGYADGLLVDYVQSIKKIKPPIFFTTYHEKTPIMSNPLNENFDFRNSEIKYDISDDIIQGETLPLELARGCIFKCKFCAYPLRGKPKNDLSFLKHGDNVYKELMDNYEKFNTTSYIFVDDTFNDSIEKLYFLYDIFKRLPFKINFAAYIRPDLLSRYPESIDLLKDMGIKGAFFGIESLNDYSRKIILKGFSTDKLLNILQEVNKKWEDVAITSSFIYGLPGDSPNAINEWTNNIVYGSGIFDNHDLIFQALYIQGSGATYKSDFDEDMEKYNYRVETGKRGWSNDVTNFNEVAIMAKEANLKAAILPRPFSSFHCVTLLGYGLSMKEIMKLDSHNINDINFIENLTIKRFESYANLTRE